MNGEILALTGATAQSAVRAPLSTGGVVGMR